jgi:serine acetyltransferase
VVREGATIGAGCIVGCNLEIGRWAMIGMGSIVTKSIPDFCLAIGTPARVIGVVCRCGEPVHRFSDADNSTPAEATCQCGRAYSINNHVVTEIETAVVAQ